VRVEISNETRERETKHEFASDLDNLSLSPLQDKTSSPDLIHIHASQDSKNPRSTASRGERGGRSSIDGELEIRCSFPFLSFLPSFASSVSPNSERLIYIPSHPLSCPRIPPFAPSSLSRSSTSSLKSSTFPPSRPCASSRLAAYKRALRSSIETRWSSRLKECSVSFVE